MTNDLLNSTNEIKKKLHERDVHEEIIAISRIKDNKYLFKHTKKKRTNRSTIGPLVNANNEITSDPKEMAE